ncbi:hypothetical protein B0H10DRAFT_2236070 [Mycena sp. CBHHK59/15]|nr:hypothetical protein B0H10DRAFT_2236070 [Mycena sp. CBHHK59/15]
MDGRKRNASFNADGDGVDGERGGMEHGVGAGGMQDGEEEEEEEDEDMHDILRGVREEHQEEEEEEVRAMSVEDDEEQECSREDQDEEEEEEEEEVRRMSIEPEPAPRFVVHAPNLISTAPSTQHPALTPPARRAPTVPARSERQLPRPSFASGYSQTHPDADRGQDAWDAEQREEVDEDDEEEQTHVLAGVGERVDSRALLRAAQLDRALIDADADADAEVEVDADGDGASDSDDGGVLGLVKITSADPRAAARAAAILKQHDYDCFTKLRLQRERAKKRHSLAGGTISVVGEQVYFPGSPKPVTMAQLLAEAEREVGAASPPRKDAGMSLSTPLGTGDAYTTPVRASTHSHSHFNFDSASAPFTPAPPLRVGGLVERRPSSGLAREVVLSDDEGQDEDATGQGQDGETGGQRAWTKDDWKALDACFTDERIALVASKASSNAEADAVELAPADVVDVHAVVRRFVRMMGGERAVAQYGDAWGVETLTQRAMALQSKQRAGMVAPPTPRASSTSSPSFASASTTRAPDDDSVFATHKRRPSMEAPDLTPLGRRARKPRLPAPLGTDAPFANLAPEPERRRRLPASLLAPRYSHLLEEAVSVSQGAPPPAEEEPDADVDSSFASSTSASTGVEMPPATPLREKEERAAQRPASLGRRVTGFLFSYLPTLSKTAPPPTRRPAGPARPGLPLPPLDILEKPRGPINTPVRPPLPRTRPPKELVTLQPAPAPPKPPTRIPRAAPPKRLVELQHVVAPEASVRVGPRPRTSSGGSVKDLVKNFEALDGARKRAPEVKRVRSVGEFGNGSKKPMWRP